jgi:hypothetical protein
MEESSRSSPRARHAELISASSGAIQPVAECANLRLHVAKELVVGLAQPTWHEQSLNPSAVLIPLWPRGAFAVRDTAGAGTSAFHDEFDGTSSTGRAAYRQTASAVLPSTSSCSGLRPRLPTTRLAPSSRAVRLIASAG